ncbi:MAG: VWA domain-containing protein [Anaerolineaceae bacterium]
MNQSSKRLSVFINLAISLFLIFSFIVPNYVVSADSDEAPSSDQCFSLDVIFIIDQSGSMSVGSNANDPMEQRKYAVEAAIDQLADNALDRCPKSIHQIGIISFGTESQVDLDMGVINPETANEAKVIRDRLKTDVKTVNLGYTDPIEAFKMANRLFKSNFSSSTVSEEAGLRKRVIIFVTDGVPEINGALNTAKTIAYMQEMEGYITTAFPFNDILLKQANCLSTLEDRFEEVEKAPQEDIDNCLSSFPVTQKELDGSTYIFGLFMPSNAAYPLIIDEWQKIVDSHQGQLFFMSNNRQEVSSTVRTIVSGLIGIKLNVVSCGSFAVNPYLKKAVLTFFKSNPDLSVTLSYQDAKGEMHTVTDGKVGDTGGFDVAEHTLDGSNERYVINQPYPGIWELNATAGQCEGLDAYYDPVVIQPGSYQPNLPAEVAQFENPPYFDKYNPQYLEYQVKDIGGTILSQADDPRLAIQIDLKVTDPKGTVTPYDMDWVADQKLFKTAKPLELAFAGPYTISMVGSYLEHTGDVTVKTTNYSEIFTQKVILFDHQAINFNVHSVTPFTMQLDQPKNGRYIGTVHESILSGWPLKINPVDVSVTLLDQSGAPLDPSKVLTDPTNPFEISIISGDKTSVVSSLVPDSSSPNVFTGKIENTEFVGKQTVQVKLVSKYDEYFRPQDEILTANVTRLDNLFTSPGTYYVILAILVLYLIARVLAWSYGKKHRLVGYILAKQNGTVMRVLNLATGSNKAKFSYAFWQKDPARSLGIKSLIITNIAASRNAAVPDPIDLGANNQVTEDAKVAYRYYMQNGDHNSGILIAGNDDQIGNPDDRVSLEFVPNIAEGYQYAQNAEDSGQKMNLLQAFLFIFSLVAALLLVFVMFF